MERYRDQDPFDERRESRIEKDNGDWCYEKKNGRWQTMLLPKLPLLDPAGYPERERRTDNVHQMLIDTAEQWKLNDSSVKPNEGFLRDHPLYHDLFIKWAMRYLHQEGFDKSKYSGRIDDAEGNLLDNRGRYSKAWLVNEVANAREWVDEYVALELRISEGFVDITHDYERREELGIEPEHSGWWTQNEI